LAWPCRHCCSPAPTRSSSKRRRDFITLLGGAAAAWPVAARAQSEALPIVGYLGSGSIESTARMLSAFRKGLAEVGYMEGRNVAIEYRWADGQYDRLPGLASELVRRPVNVIAAPGATVSAVAAKSVTTSIPIVFAVGADPVEVGLVASLNRPGGNITGVSFLATTLAAKMLEVLHEATPAAIVVAALMNPSNPNSVSDKVQVREAARVLGLQLHILDATSEREIDDAFAAMLERRVGALFIEGDPLFTSRLRQLVALSVRHAIPAIYQGRDFVEAGGLMSYGADRVDAFRIAGTYAGRVLKGEKPAVLPVQQSTKIELAVNLTTAKAIGLTLPLTLLGRADEVIE
jgi:putative ABC transport system substrate-binding protein